MFRHWFSWRSWRLVISLPAKRFGLFLLMVILLGVAGARPGADELPGERPAFDQVTLSLDRGDGTILTYRVELATTPRQHAYGLMHLPRLDIDAGMLFVFDGMAVRSFWMKNTLIPLDMLFFDDRGRLVSAVRHVPAKSLAARRPDGPAKFVLELNAGVMDADGIGPFARLRLPIDP